MRTSEVQSTGSKRKRRTRPGRHLLAVVGLLGAAHAFGQTAPSAPSTSSGNYTVSYAPCSGCYQHWLEEKVGDDGTWRYVGSGNKSFSGKSPGRYHYRVAYFYYDPAYLYWNYSGYTTYGATRTVTVGSQVPVDPLEEQISYRYDVRRGDINGDGRNDLLVDRRSGGRAGNGVLEFVILRQQSNGQFTPLVPTASQLATSRRWPVASAKPVVRDVNADGFADVILKGVSKAVGTSRAADQVVHSPGRGRGKAPLGVRAVDARFRKFARNVHDYLASPSYFYDHAPLVAQTTTVWEVWCNYGTYGDIDYSSIILDCSWWPVQVTTVARDYSGFDQHAVSIWSNESAIKSNTKTRSKGLDAIEQIVEQVLNVPVGGWDPGGRGEPGSLDDPLFGRGFGLFSSLFGISVAEGSEAPRRSNTVYVTGRRVIGWLPFKHTALEYNRSTLSAYDNDSRMLLNGVLVSERNWAGDLPHLMMTLGTASRSGSSPAAYWTQLVASDSRYDDNLPYDPVPAPGYGRYNSNGFVHGLLRATGGRASVDMNQFPGGNVPVPASAFR